MGEHEIFVGVVGEPFRSRALAYFAELDAARLAWRGFARKVGADSLTDPLGALGFEGPPPKGWIAKTANGRSRPKKGTPAAAEMAALPAQPSSRAVFAEAVLYAIVYEGDDVRGSCAVGRSFFAPRIDRVGDLVVAVVPHAGRAAAEHLARHPDHRIVNGAAGWTVPEGLVEISRAGVDFLLAEHRLRAEREAAPAAA